MNGNQPNQKSTKEFVAGIILSLVILPTILFFGFYSIILWLILLIVFLNKKMNSLAKGMAVGIAIALFVFLIVCGSLILGY